VYHQKKLALAFLLFASIAGAGPFEFLAPDGIPALKKKPCTLIHAWAVWCTICIEEMPRLVEFFEKNKKINPVVIDVSPKIQQENFSKRWPVLLSAPFKNYLKPEKIKDEIYLTAIDSKWSGSLPYTALYMGGVKRKQWVGSLDFSVLGREVHQTCK
jgi:hypothetical protein